ncbi:MAG: hypothetical protein QXI89_02240 [Candidatus Anstonellales archaeon]
MRKILNRFSSRERKENKVKYYLFISAFLGNEEELRNALDLGLKYGLNPASIKDRHGRTALHYARGSKTVGLMKEHRADLNAKDILGMTPLHLAYIMKDEEKIEALKRAGARTDLIDIFYNTASSYEVFDIARTLNQSLERLKEKEVISRVTMQAINVTVLHSILNTYLKAHPEVLKVGEIFLKSYKTDNGISEKGLITLLRFASDISEIARKAVGQI